MFKYDRDTLRGQAVEKTYEFQQGKPCTKVDADEIVRMLLPEIQSFWPDVPMERVVAPNHHGDNILTKEMIQVIFF